MIPPRGRKFERSNVRLGLAATLIINVTILTFTRSQKDGSE
jgi:hypothetical protein